MIGDFEIPPPREVAKWGPLLVTRGPHDLYWRGIRRQGLTRMQLDIMFTLAVTGRADSFALELLSSANNGNCIKVQMTRIRRWLEGNGIPVEIVNIPRVGYELRAEL